MTDFQYEFKVPMFPMRILLVVSDSPVDCCREMGLELLSIHEKGAVYNTIDEEHIPYHCVILLRPEFCKENTLVHESFHVLHRIMKVIDTPLTDDTEEVYAYVLEYIYRIIREKTIEAKEVLNGNKNP